MSATASLVSGSKSKTCSAAVNNVFVTKNCAGQRVRRVPSGGIQISERHARRRSGQEEDSDLYSPCVVRIFQLVKQIDRGQGSRIESRLGDGAASCKEKATVDGDIVVVFLPSTADQLTRYLDDSRRVEVVAAIIVVVPSGDHELRRMRHSQRPAPSQKPVVSQVRGHVDKDVVVMRRIVQGNHRLGRVGENGRKIFTNKSRWDKPWLLTLAGERLIIRTDREESGPVL